MSQTINFDRWIMSGSGWEVSFVAQLENLTVTRAYGSDYATVSGKAWIKSVGGSTNTKAKFWIQLNSSTWTEVNIAGSNGSGGWYTYWAGDWYSQTFSFNVSVGASAGSISGQVCFSVYDINGPSADSEYKTYAQSYGSKGASSITSATNVTLSTSGTVNSSVSWTAYSNTFTYVLSASLGGYSASATYSSLSGNVTKTLGFSSSFINAITTSKSATCTITLTTKSGSTVIGTSTKNITLTVPSGINPSVTISTQKVSALSSTYFANKYCTLIDKMQVTLTASAQYSATISSRSITANGETGTATPWTTSALQNYGTNTVNASVTDSRGNSRSATPVSVNVYWYFYPTVSVKYRHGTDYYLDLSGRIAYVGGDQTTKQLRLSIYKGSTLVVDNLILDSYIASSPSGGTYDGYYEISGSYPIPSEYISDIDTETYEFRLTVTDSVSSSSASAYSGIAVMTFGAGGTNIIIHKQMYYNNQRVGWEYLGGYNGNVIQAPNQVASYGRMRAFVNTNADLFMGEFEALITTAAPSSSSSLFTCGIYRSWIQNGYGLDVVPIANAGWWERWDSGTQNFNYSGYATVFSYSDSAFWSFARVYNTSGNYGAWSNYTVAPNTDVRYKGVIYGRIQ